jgi:threonine dehydratase
MIREPTIDDVQTARSIISPHLHQTPLLKSAELSQRFDMNLYLKYENLQVTGAFKVRGGVNLLAQMSHDEKQKGVITASTGNHGQSIAYAASLFGVKALIAMPEQANPLKVAAIKKYNGEIIFHGKDFDEARIWVEQEADRHGYRYVHSGNEPLLIAGVGTLYLEMMEVMPHLDTVIVPVGGGSCASAACIVMKHFNPNIRIIGVQANQASAVFQSWKSGAWVETASADTMAEGLATRAPFMLPLQIMRRLLDDFVVVNEDEIMNSILLLLEVTHQVAEGAGVAAMAAAIQLRNELQGQNVGVVLSGGNLPLSQLRALLHRR